MAKALVKYFGIALVLILVTFLICSEARSNKSGSSSSRTIRFPLYHREKFIASNFKDQRSLVRTRLARDNARFHRRHASSSAQFHKHSGNDLNYTAVLEEGGEYVTVLKVGSPSQNVQLLVDIGTPLTWWQCQPNCKYCYSTPHHIFDTSTSSTYTETDCAEGFCDVTQLFILGCIRRDDPKCHYRVQYVDGSVSQGVMARDVVATSEGVTLHNSFSFGCGRSNQGVTMFNADATGILGFVPGGYSFPSQLQANTFSFCLPTYNTTTSGSLYLNYYPSAFQYSSRSMLIIRTGHYYLDFSGVEINQEAIPIPPENWQCDREGVGGVIIDTGSTITRFPKKAYDIFKDYFLRNAQGLPLSQPEEQLDTCFNVAGVGEWEGFVPKVRFLFKWPSGRPLEFETGQLLMSVGNNKYCLAFGAGGPTTIIGSWQLQGSLVGFDLPNHLVGFLRASC
ncbi:PREDICTED: ASPARTIC PROTEASE IN [Prunus dulcis]|uniref:PREDICTED: ASPARTIC PROTEASE IN n=1 Tax=Prunus dulcis TaxID=3755 RepID=A0A5E4F136_PRUDU|nr:protein ASPARTIC PROTEASE IN GUARD CELL 2-like isoform X1 [Prunus dulcis]KAI5330361.1 hypothetical protein L3X38_029759 [Prunus dulcis]VVA21412.1 PREDICTED: ASPARTIC PROTEASE IN [Prunus dulcis]